MSDDAVAVVREEIARLLATFAAPAMFLREADYQTALWAAVHARLGVTGATAPVTVVSPDGGSPPHRYEALRTARAHVEIEVLDGTRKMSGPVDLAVRSFPAQGARTAGRSGGDPPDPPGCPRSHSWSAAALGEPADGLDRHANDVHDPHAPEAAGVAELVDGRLAHPQDGRDLRDREEVLRRQQQGSSRIRGAPWHGMDGLDTGARGRSRRYAGLDARGLPWTAPFAAWGASGRWRRAVRAAVSAWSRAELRRRGSQWCGARRN